MEDLEVLIDGSVFEHHPGARSTVDLTNFISRPTGNVGKTSALFRKPGIVVETIHDPLLSPTLEPVDGCSEAELHWVKEKSRELFQAQKHYEAMKMQSIYLLGQSTVCGKPPEWEYVSGGVGWQPREAFEADWHQQQELIQLLHERLDRAEADAHHWANVAQQCDVQVIQEDLLAESERAVKHWQETANTLKEQLKQAEKKYSDARDEMELMRERLEDEKFAYMKEMAIAQSESSRLMALKNEEFLKRQHLEEQFKQQPNWKKAWQHLTEDYGNLERLNRQLFVSCIVAVTFSLTLIGILVFK